MSSAPARDPYIAPGRVARPLVMGPDDRGFDEVDQPIIPAHCLNVDDVAVDVAGMCRPTDHRTESEL